MRFKITYDLGGSLCGSGDEFEEEFETQSQADQEAYEKACELYDSFVGMYGLRTEDDIAKEESLDDLDEIRQIFEQERESWLEYSAVPIS